MSSFYSCMERFYSVNFKFAILTAGFNVQPGKISTSLGWEESTLQTKVPSYLSKINSSNMKVTALFLALAGSAAAFAPSAQKASTTAISANIDDIGGATLPFPKFDPFDLASLGSESTLSWFRAAELKHSRVAMLATTGYIVQAAGFHFPGQLSTDVSFASLSAMKPLDAWSAVPEAGTSHKNDFVPIIVVLLCYHSHPK